MSAQAHLSRVTRARARALRRVSPARLPISADSRQLRTSARRSLQAAPDTNLLRGRASYSQNIPLPSFASILVTSRAHLKAGVSLSRGGLIQRGRANACAQQRDAHSPSKTRRRLRPSSPGISPGISPGRRAPSEAHSRSEMETMGPDACVQPLRSNIRVKGTNTRAERCCRFQALKLRGHLTSLYGTGRPSVRRLHHVLEAHKANAQKQCPKKGGISRRISDGEERQGRASGWRRGQQSQSCPGPPKMLECWALCDCDRRARWLGAV